MADHKVNAKNFLFGAAVGGLIGAVAALLFAPKSGKELRTDISEHAAAAAEKTKKIAEDVSQHTQKITQNVSEHTQEWLDKAKHTVVQLRSGKPEVKQEEEAASSSVEYTQS